MAERGEGGIVTPMEVPQPGVQVPKQQGMMASVKAGIGGVLRAASEWFGPGVPYTPVAPDEVAGRGFDFPFASNLQTKPRVYEVTKFEDLRFLADGCEILRLVIETRKDQICKMAWNICYKDEKKEPDEACKKMQDFFQSPDKLNDWDVWLRLLLEDMFVIDAPTLYRRQTAGGEVYAWEVIDGATIMPILDPWGRRPLVGEAYQQTLKGLPAVGYTDEELVQRPRNKRSWKVYGFSPVEQVQYIANLTIRRELHKLRYYTDGSKPDLILVGAEGWTPDQIIKFKRAWDDQLRGNSKERQGTWVIPYGVAPIDTKDKALKEEFDEWLARLVCYCFSVPPTPFVKQMNRATAESAQQAALEEGLAPIMKWVSSLVTELLRRMGRPEMHHKWEAEKDIDPYVAAQIDEIYVRNKIKKVNEVRETLGLEPVEEPEPVAAPGGPGAPGVVPLGQPGQEEPQAQSQVPGQVLPQPKGAKAVEQPSKRVGEAKVKKSTPRINRDRPSIEALFVKTKGGIQTRLHKMKLIAVKMAKKIMKDAAKSSNDPRINDMIKAMDWDGLRDYLAEQDLAAFLDGIAAAEAQVGVDLNFDNALAQKWADEHAGELIKEVTETTREYLESTISKGLEEGWSADDLAKEIGEGWGFDEARAEMIARTEIQTADIQANIQVYQESGMVTKFTFITADTDPCDECEEKNDKVFDLDDDDNTPPIHPNCRCDVLAVIERDTSTSTDTTEEDQ